MKNQKPEVRLEVGQIENSCKISEWEDNLSFFTSPLNLGQCDYDRLTGLTRYWKSRKCWYPNIWQDYWRESCGGVVSGHCSLSLQCYSTAGTNIVSDHRATDHHQTSAPVKIISSQSKGQQFSALPGLDEDKANQIIFRRHTPHPTPHLTRLKIISIRIAEFLHKKIFKITNIFCWLVLYGVNYGDITGYKHKTAGVLTRSQDEHFLSISPSQLW